MNQEEVNRALRFIAAGAPVPEVHCYEGWYEHRRYERAYVDGKWQTIPLLSDSSWYGWTLAEVERRGYRYSFKVWGEGKTFYESAVWKGNGAINSVRFNSRSEHLVYMLEAAK